MEGAIASGPNDQVHYNAVRRALQNGNAAVMVGAGFSKNAENGDELAMGKKWLKSSGAS